MEYLQYDRNEIQFNQKFFKVLNLVISGIPSIHSHIIFWKYIWVNWVLNLVISGIPSILIDELNEGGMNYRFKPCYKWNTFNTLMVKMVTTIKTGFKPCYKWNTFNTSIYCICTYQIHLF